MSRINPDELPDDARLLTKRWIENFHRGKDRHEQTRRKAERYYALYRSYRELKSTYSDGNKSRDVDSLLRDAQAGFGADLFIPYVFSVIETTLARMLSQAPTMKVKPAPTTGGIEALMRAEKNCANHRVLLEKQLSQTDYHLTVQDVGKEALIAGLGVQKVRWVEKWVNGQKILEPATAREDGGPDWVTGSTDALVYSGPVAEHVSIFEWIHDPRGHSMETIRWCIHRMWFDDEEVKDRIEKGTWELPEGVELDDVLEGGSSEKRSEIWSNRDATAGFSNRDDAGGEQLHEVWECWDGETVTTIIDRACPVQHGPNPFWHGEMPFQIFRPTRVPGEMLGVGEAEAIEDLQEEMNVLRTQRRDNASFVLQRPFAYFEGMVDAADFQWAPGVGLPVDGDPTNVLKVFDVPEIPHSSYQEETNLQKDIERVTGIDDAGSGVSGQTSTATEAQIVQQMAGVRIANKTRLLELECVKRGARHFGWLNQQKYGVGEGGVNRPISMVGPPRDDDEEAVSRGWSPYEMGPETLGGGMEFEPDAGSMAPPNDVEKRDQATRLMQDFGQDPLMDPMKLREHVLELMGFENPRSMLREPEPQISQEELALATEQAAVQLGIDPAELAALMQEGVQQAQQLKAMEEQAAAGGGAPGQQAAPPAAQAPA